MDIDELKALHFELAKFAYFNSPENRCWNADYAAKLNDALQTVLDSIVSEIVDSEIYESAD